MAKPTARARRSALATGLAGVLLAGVLLAGVFLAGVFLAGGAMAAAPHAGTEPFPA